MDRLIFVREFSFSTGPSCHFDKIFTIAKDPASQDGKMNKYFL